MTKRKKWLAGAVLVFALMALFLCAFTLISTSHRNARLAIERSAVIAESVGSVRYVVLVGVRQKLKGYEGTSCTNATYVVIGSSGMTVAVVVQRLPPGAADWQVQSLSKGWFSDGGAAC